MASVIKLKAAKAARKILDGFYIKVLGRPRIKVDAPTSLRVRDMEKKFPYLKAYRN